MTGRTYQPIKRQPCAMLNFIKLLCIALTSEQFLNIVTNFTKASKAEQAVREARKDQQI